MGDSTEPVALEYRSPPRPIRRQRQLLSPEERRWRRWRFGYYLALVALFLSIAFYFGPHYWNFGKLTNVSPADFVENVKHDGVPVVRAIKRYQRDNGRLPVDFEEIPKEYLQPDPNLYGRISSGEVIIQTRYFEWMVYSLTPGHEGWSVRGYFTNGVVPVTPAVDISAAPTTRS